MPEIINKKNKNTGPSSAEQADIHLLYEKSVQCVEPEIDFIDDTFSKLRGRAADIMREDFCGTTNTSCEWIKRRETNIAHAVDIDHDVLEWGKQHHIANLTPSQADRMHVYESDVMQVNADPADVVLAMNFSYFLFKQRDTLKTYFLSVYKSLKEDGILFLDAFGGYDAFREMEESAKHKGFTYIWDQDYYNPITGDCTMRIHFKFKDGSKIKNAFIYEWRLWTLAEITELLGEAGFKATVYWEGEDEDGDGNGEFTASTLGTADAGWIAYIVAEK